MNNLVLPELSDETKFALGLLLGGALIAVTLIVIGIREIADQLGEFNDRERSRDKARRLRMKRRRDR